ncbi:MAG TPA: hypothetical protein VL335_02945, partial [Candidatus Paceibacterota bacterium]|nr:hypothetical protein [Candidatus Paceibacterota bacterium]
FFTGNLGIGTTSPFTALAVMGNGYFANNVTASYFTATSTTATSTFAGSFSAGNGAFTTNYDSGVTNIASLQTGAMSFDTDAGVISWVNLPISGTPSAGTVESYSAQIGTSPILTVYGEANGSGGSQNLRLGIGTTSPFATLSVAGDIALTGGLYDNTTSRGTNGMVLQTTGTGVQWVATSSLGIVAGASGAAYPFTPATNFGSTNQATTGIAWFQNGINASSTSNFASANFYGGVSINAAGVDTGLNLIGNVNSFYQGNIQNTNTGSSVSSDWVATANNGTASTHYIDMGINGNNGGATPFTTANHAYLYSIDDTLNIGALGSAANIQFYTTGGLTPIERMRITNTGNVGIGTTSPFTTLSVAGNGYYSGTVTASAFISTSTTATSTISGSLQVGTGSGSDAAMQFGPDTNAWTVGYKSSDKSYRISSSTALGTNDIFTLNKTGNFTLNSTGATSTINGNLYVNGTMRATNSYAGDLIFANGFRFTEASTTATTTPNGAEGLYLQNHKGQSIMSVDENGNLTVPGDVCANGAQCYGQSLSSLSTQIATLQSSLALATSTNTSLVSGQNSTQLSLAEINGVLVTTNNNISILSGSIAALSASTTNMSVSITNLEAQVASTTFAFSSIASTTGAELATSTSFIQSVALAVYDLMQSSGQVINSAGDWTVHQITATLGIFEKVTAGRVETQTAAVSNGLEMKSPNGSVWCVRIDDYGTFQRTQGTCDTATTTTATTIAQPTTYTAPVTTTSTATAPTTSSTTTSATTTSTVTNTTTTATSTSAGAVSTTDTTVASSSPVVTSTNTTSPTTTTTSPATTSGTTDTTTTSTTPTTSTTTTSPSTTDTTTTTTAPAPTDTTTAPAPADTTTSAAPVSSTDTTPGATTI